MPHLCGAMFILLKVLLFFFRPLIWALVLLLIAAFSKNEARRKRLLALGLAVLLLFSNPLIWHISIKNYEAPVVQRTAQPVYDAGIVLGGFVSYSPADRTGFFNPASDRFIQTALLYKKGVIKNIIIAAGNGYWKENGFREAHFAKQQFITLGIPASVVYTDVQSRNTEENAVYSKRIADSTKLTGKSVLITSAFHMPRAQYIFRKKGLHTDPYPCDFMSKNRGNNFWEDNVLPSAAVLRNWDMLLKEWLGYAVYRIKG